LEKQVELCFEEKLFPTRTTSIRKKGVGDFYIIDSLSKMISEKKVTIKQAKSPYKKILSLIDFDMCSIEFRNNCITIITETDGLCLSPKIKKETTRNGYLIANFWRRISII
jgi:hypothetical protein